MDSGLAEHAQHPLPRLNADRREDNACAQPHRVDAHASPHTRAIVYVHIFKASEMRSRPVDHFREALLPVNIPAPGQVLFDG